MSKLPDAPRESIIFENGLLYVCLASFPITPGHTIVIWKGSIPDLHNLSDSEYEYVMNIVDVTRDALLTTLGVEKVYLLYMDEVRQVHWHLVPRYNEKGFNVFAHEPVQTTDFSIAPKLKRAFEETLLVRDIHLPQ